MQRTIFPIITALECKDWYINYVKIGLVLKLKVENFNPQEHF